VWTHVAITWTGGQQTGAIYLNGASQPLTTNVANTVNVLPTTAVTLQFGANTSQTFNSFSGAMSDVIIWNRVLGADEVKALYQGQGAALSFRPTPVIAIFKPAPPPYFPAPRRTRTYSIPRQIYR
jgi:hypothetical protein